MPDYPLVPIPAMLTTTPPGGSTAFVTVNGMFSTTPSPQLTPSPATLLPISPGIASPGLLSTPSPYILPSSGFPHTSATNMTCNASPFGSAPFSGSLFPFFNPINPGMLTGNSPISIPPSFPPVPHLLQPHVSGNPLSSFPSAISVTSVINPLNSQAQLLSEANSLAITTGPSNLLTNQLPPHSIMLPLPPINIGSSTSSNDILAFPLAPTSSSASASSTCEVRLPITANSCSTTSTQATAAYTAVTVSSPTANSNVPIFAHPSFSEPSCVAPNLQTSFRIDKSLPVCSNMTSRSAGTHNLLSLEAVDFHRDDILDAIDKLRERKARPDFERISCMLKRHRNINPDQTQLCLGRLAAAGAVVCVDYKGNISYRNPSKWRKTSITSGVTNSSGISQRLVSAVRHLIDSSLCPPKSASHGDQSLAPLQPALPGPHGGYSLFQIERALQTLKASTSESNSSPSKITPELTGATLRVCLDREAIHGKLAKTPDGRYILDETGERKRLASVSVASSPLVFHKKPLPPNNSSSFLISGNSGKNSKACVGESVTRPLAVKQVPSGGVSIAPHASRLAGSSPLFGVANRVGFGRRGRPPGSKSRKYSLQSHGSSSSEKKIKIEPSPTSGRPVSVDSPVLSTCANSSPTSHSTTNTLAVFAPKPGSAPPVFPLSRNGFCPSSAVASPHLPHPTSFLTSAPQSNNMCPILSTAFTGSQTADLPFSHPFSGQFLAFSACQTATCSGGLPLSLVPPLAPALSCSSIFTKTEETLDASSIIHAPSALDLSEAVPLGTEKSDDDNENFCCHCGLQATSEDPFLVCKDCDTHAHPNCLDYWPELTERARQSAWQCADCKTCTVCETTQSVTELLVCDACDKGFHLECHVPKLSEPVDRSLPWVCADCRREGYSVAIGTLPDDISGSYVNEDTNETSDLTQNERDDCAVDEKLTEAVDNSEAQPSDSYPMITSSGTSNNSPIDDSHSKCQTSGSSALCSLIQGYSVPFQDGEVTVSNTNVCDHETLPTNGLNSNTECVVNFADDSHVVLQEPVPTELTTLPNNESREINRPIRVISDSPPVHSDENILDNELLAADDRDDVDLNITDEPGETNLLDVSVHNARSSDIRVWSVEYVKQWLLEEGFPREADAFFQQEIDGACLLLMKRMDVLTELGIKLGPAVKIYERIKRLQSRCTSPAVMNL